MCCIDSKKIKFIDLFAGIGGIRKGFELACKKNGIASECVFTSEIKPYAVSVLMQNHPEEKVFGDITKIEASEIPGFDIADFRMYSEEIIEKPYMLDVDYLIFGYDMGDDGIVTIKDVWLKKVWEITRPMEEWSINLQVKQGQVHKIRPGVWYSKKPRDFYMFENLEDFISAVEQAVFQNPKTHENAGTWRSKFLKSYQNFYGEKLDIPRWFDIENKYRVKKGK